MVLCASVSGAQSSVVDGPKPVRDYVPDEATAIKIAVAVWEPIYGRAIVAREGPYAATFVNGVWHVAGIRPEGSIGGTIVAEIAKTDGRILLVSLEQ